MDDRRPAYSRLGVVGGGWSYRLGLYSSYCGMQVDAAWCLSLFLSCCCVEVPLGVDTFDSCYPTRLGRHGTLLVRGKDGMEKRVIARSGKWAQVHEPPDHSCPCPLCQRYTMAYLNHLIKSNEPLAGTLGTMHNLAYMATSMADYREKILRDEV